MKPAAVVYRGKEAIKGDEPDKEFAGCGLCVVEVEGTSGLLTSCNTPAASGMVVHTSSPLIEQHRKDKFSELIAKHPHYCLTCDQRQGCSPFDKVCQRNVTVLERCCIKGHLRTTKTGRPHRGQGEYAALYLQGTARTERGTSHGPGLQSLYRLHALHQGLQGR